MHDLRTPPRTLSTLVLAYRRQERRRTLQDRLAVTTRVPPSWQPAVLRQLPRGTPLLDRIGNRAEVVSASSSPLSREIDT